MKLPLSLEDLERIPTFTVTYGCPNDERMKEIFEQHVHHVTQEEQRSSMVATTKSQNPSDQKSSRFDFKGLFKFTKFIRSGNTPKTSNNVLISEDDLTITNGSLIEVAKDFIDRKIPNHSDFDVLNRMSHQGATGITLRWDTLWEYRSTHIQATIRHFQNTLVKHYQDLPFFQASAVNVAGKTMTLLVYVYAVTPLIFQTALNDTQQAKERTTHIYVQDFLTRRIDQLYDSIIAHMAQGLEKTTWGTSYLTVGMNWDNPMAETRTTRDFGIGGVLPDRREPLQFPTMAPPYGKTHMSGRWIQSINDVRKRWISYVGGAPTERYITPYNVSMDPSHWVERTLPGIRIPIKDMEHLTELVMEARTKSGMSTTSLSDSLPLNVPFPEDLNRPRKLGANAIVDPIKMVPEDSMRRTPLRYAPAKVQAEPTLENPEVLFPEQFAEDPHTSRNRSTHAPRRPGSTQSDPTHRSDHHINDRPGSTQSDHHTGSTAPFDNTGSVGYNTGNHPPNNPASISPIFRQQSSDNSGTPQGEGDRYRPTKSELVPDYLRQSVYDTSFYPIDPRTKMSNDVRQRHQSSGHQYDPYLPPHVDNTNYQGGSFGSHDSGGRPRSRSSTSFAPAPTPARTNPPYVPPEPFDPGNSTSRGPSRPSGHNGGGYNPHGGLSANYHGHGGSGTNHGTYGSSQPRRGSSGNGGGHYDGSGDGGGSGGGHGGYGGSGGGNGGYGEGSGGFGPGGPGGPPPNGPDMPHGGGSGGSPFGGGGGGSGPPGPPYAGAIVPAPYTKTFTMKPDLKYFQKLQDESDFSAWHEHTRATCNGFNMGECCDFRYRPQPHELESFNNKTKFFYTVMLNVIKIARGKAILYRNRATFDGRRVLFELCHMLASTTAASHDAEKLYAQLVNTKITREWKKPYAEFISWFTETAERYNVMVFHPDRQLRPLMIKSMLERAVTSRIVKIIVSWKAIFP